MRKSTHDQHAELMPWFEQEDIEVSWDENSKFILNGPGMEQGIILDLIRDILAKKYSASSVSVGNRFYPKPSKFVHITSTKLASFKILCRNDNLKQCADILMSVYRHYKRACKELATFAVRNSELKHTIKG